jgi:hypothetical protein
MNDIKSRCGRHFVSFRHKNGKPFFLIPGTCVVLCSLKVLNFPESDFFVRFQVPNQIEKQKRPLCVCVCVCNAI